MTAVRPGLLLLQSVVQPLAVHQIPCDGSHPPALRGRADGSLPEPSLLAVAWFERDHEPGQVEVFTVSFKIERTIRRFHEQPVDGSVGLPVVHA